MLTDTHCHLYYDEIKKDITNVLNRAEKLGVNRFICVGTNMEDSLQCFDLAEKYDNIFASAGIHPHDSKNAPTDFLDQIKKVGYFILIFFTKKQYFLTFFRNNRSKINH